MDEQFYAYLAGFIDADGCFQIHKHKNKKCKRGFHWQPVISIAQADRDFLEWLKEKIGFGMIIDQYPNFRLDFSSGHIRKLLPNILPYLRKKKTQALLITKALELLKHTGSGHHYDADERLEELWRELGESRPRNRFDARSKYWLKRKELLAKAKDLV